MQWLNSLDTAIDRLTTPRRQPQQQPQQQQGDNARSVAYVAPNDDAEAAMAEDDGFSDGSDISAAGADSGGTAHQIISIDDDEAAAVSPLRSTADTGMEEGESDDEEEEGMGEEDAFVNANGPGPLDAPQQDVMMMEEEQAEQEAAWPPPIDAYSYSQPGPPAAAPPAAPPMTNAGASSPRTRTRARARPRPRPRSALDAPSTTQAIPKSPFPGRLVKRARPPSPPTTLTEDEYEDEDEEEEEEWMDNEQNLQHEYVGVAAEDTAGSAGQDRQAVAELFRTPRPAPAPAPAPDPRLPLPLVSTASGDDNLGNNGLRPKNGDAPLYGDDDDDDKDDDDKEQRIEERKAAEEEGEDVRAAAAENAVKEAERLKAEEEEEEDMARRKREAERLRAEEAEAAARLAAAEEAAARAEAERLRLKQEAEIKEAERIKVEKEMARRREAERLRAEETEAARLAAAEKAAAEAEAEQLRLKEEAEARAAEEARAVAAARAEAEQRAQVEAERRRIAEEQARVEEASRIAAAHQARAAAYAKAAAERRAKDEAERMAAQERTKESKMQASGLGRSTAVPPMSAFSPSPLTEEPSDALGQSAESDVETVEEYQDSTMDEDEHDLDTEDEDYQVHLPLQPWDTPQLSLGKDGHDDGTVEISSLASPLPQWDPAMNRRGVVQIRLHRAQRLPCPAGKSVRANISLPPWRGKVTTQWVKSYSGPEGVGFEHGDGESYIDDGAGICARWDDLDSLGEKDAGARVSGGDVDDANVDERSKSSTTSRAPVMTYNMVHQYNDADTPVPDIAIELTSSSMLSFEQTMSVAVPLSAGVLMREPGIWRRRWCPALPPGKDGAPQPSSPRRAVSGGISGDGGSAQAAARRKYSADAFNSYGTAETLGPLVLLEARFVPASLGRSVGDEKDEEELRRESDTLDGSESQSIQDASFPLESDLAPSLTKAVPGSQQSVPSRSSFFDAATSSNLSYEVPLETPLSITNIAATSGARPTLDAFMEAEADNKADADNQSVTSALTASTATRSQRRLLQAKPHHLRVLPSWSSPTWCSVCSTLMVPFRDTSYQCETCSIYCCINCQLRIDVRLPCGSDEAKKAADLAKRSTITGALGELVSVMAPVEETTEETDDRDATAFNGEGMVKAEASEERSDGVGSLRIKLVRACLYDRPYAPETDLDYIRKKEGRALRVGDHYARITWTDSGAESKRTRTVFQTAKPLFDSEVMEFSIPHYAEEYRIEVVDANTDKVVGTCLLPVQSLLQWQRDEVSTSSTLPLSSILDVREQRPMYKKAIVALRQGVKSGFGLDYFNAAKKDDSNNKNNKDASDSGRAGEISGWIECDLEIAEDTKGLICGPEPRGIASRSPDDFRIDLVQLHIARIGALISDLKKLAEAYSYLISWEDPALTSLSLIVFVWLCIRFNMEYVGSLPISLIVLYMTHLWKKRRAGQFSSRWIKTEREARTQAEKKLTISYSAHRPIGFLDVAVIRGRHLRSYELGLPGAAYASISWDATRFATEADKKKIAEHDPTARANHEIGATVASGITSNPEWESVVESAESERLKQLLPADEDVADTTLDSDTNQEDGSNNQLPSIQFPILQPITFEAGASNVEERNKKDGIHLLPWTSSPGAIVVQISFQDVLNKFALIDPYFGDVVIPLKRLAEEKEIEGWFRVNDLGALPPGGAAMNGTQAFSVLADGSGNVNEMLGREALGAARKDTDYGEPEVYLKMKLALPESSGVPTDVLDAEKEASVIIAEEMMRMGAMADGDNIGLIGTSLGTINTVRGLGGQLQGIQNMLGNVLDTVERIRNLFNFSCPNRSSIVIVCLLALWLILAIIPTRAIVLVGGLAQYAASFYAAFGKKAASKKKSKPTEENSSETKPNSTATRIANFFTALPTDEDLRRAYFWEARREGEKAREELALKKRMLRLKRLWRAQWFGTVELKEATSSKQADRRWDWEPVFALIHGHRFIWWRSEKHFDDGEIPLGQIFFAGHSGLGGLSPMEMRELTREEALLVVTMFGRGMDEQQKISLLCPDKESKESLEDAVIVASTGSKTD